VRAVDLDPSESPSHLASYIFGEMLADDEFVEVGYRDGIRRALKVIAADGAPRGTGGARGITAGLAMSLARRFGCTLELVGRTPLPTEEDETTDAELADAKDPIALKRLLAARGAASSPAEIESLSRRILAEREIRATLKEIRAAGSEVRYHAVDVRDEGAFSAVIDDIYERRGWLDGVIHGAGVIEDKLLVDKTLQSFDRVFDTKVMGALTLARFGNRGQTDYAAANDLLDKLAHHLNEKLDGRVLSVNWGPWDSTGMVSPQLRREYERHGVGLISLAAGQDSLLKELATGDKDNPQVILMNAEPAAMA